MWFRSIYRKTLRDQRVAVLAWGLGLGALVAMVLGQVASLTATPEARASLESLALSFRWYSEAVAVTTPGGFATFRLGPLLPILLGIWALLAGSRTLRGEEERGSLDVLLSLPRSRARVALEKLAALGTALLLMALLITLLALAGGIGARAGFGAGDALLFGLNVALVVAVFGALALLLSQFTRQAGAAAGLTGALLALSFALDSTGRMATNAGWIGWLSPLYYYGRSKPLVPGYGVSVGAMLTLAALAALLSGAGVWFFLRRDVGAPVALPAWLRPRPRTRRPGRAPAAGLGVWSAWSLRSVYARGLGMVAVPALWWGLGLALFAAWTTAVTRQTGDFLANSPFYARFIASLGGSDALTSAAFLGAIFAFLPVLLAAFAVSQASRWAADEEEGRLELLLATPQPRPRVLLARFAALATAVVAIALVTLAVAAAAVAAAGLALDGGNLVAAALGMAPPALVVAATGYLLAGWLRTAAVTGVLSGLLVASFVISFLGAALNWPEALLQLSLFHHYGTPLVSGLPWPNMLGLIAVAVAALAAATARFARKDLAR